MGFLTVAVAIFVIALIPLIHHLALKHEGRYVRQEEAVSEDKTPKKITVWVCPDCGYWRQEKTSGVHQDWPKRNERHVGTLEPRTYILSK